MSKRDITRFKKEFVIEKQLQRALAILKKKKHLTDEQANDNLAKIYPKVYNVAKKTGKKILIKKGKAINKRRKREFEGFKKRLVLTYNPGLELLEVLVELSKELSEDTHNKLIKVVTDTDLNKFDVIVRIHGRSCQVASEIVTLINNGYPDGAGTLENIA